MNLGKGSFELSSPVVANKPNANIFTALRLSSLFNQIFCDSEKTVCIAGASEPLYAPAGVHHKGLVECNTNTDIPVHLHRIYFRHDYVRSLLHEVAHWCLAGAQRRLQIDYGYWYSPDDRDLAMQLQFEKVEVKPQALEKIFCHAANLKFAVSADNLSLQAYDTQKFATAVAKQSTAYLDKGLPVRAEMFLNGIKNA